MKTALVITGVGSVTPIGLDATVSFASLRSGITRLTAQPWPDKSGAWIVGGRVMTWTPEIRERRLRRLAGMAMREAWGRAVSAGSAPEIAPAALFLGAPEPERPGYVFPPPGFDALEWAVGLGLRGVTSA